MYTSRRSRYFSQVIFDDYSTLSIVASELIVIGISFVSCHQVDQVHLCMRVYQGSFGFRS